MSGRVYKSVKSVKIKIKTGLRPKAEPVRPVRPKDECQYGQSCVSLT